MLCRKCNSQNLAIVVSGPHQKLVCEDCLAFQKFLSKTDAETFLSLQAPEAKAFPDSSSCGGPLDCRDRSFNAEFESCIECRRQAKELISLYLPDAEMRAINQERAANGFSHLP